MSNFVNQIVRDIRKEPETWELKNGGLKHRVGAIEIVNFGNGHFLFGLWFTSICEVIICGESVRLSWRDMFRLEQSFIWWQRNASVEMLNAKL